MGSYGSAQTLKIFQLKLKCSFCVHGYAPVNYSHKLTGAREIRLKNELG